MRTTLRILLLIGFIFLAGCQASTPPGGDDPPDDSDIQVMVVESFLADIAQNIAGDRLRIEVLIPAGADPHTFQPTPQDVARIGDSQVLIINGTGLEEWLGETLDNAGGERLVIEASRGLSENSPRPEDPHFWLDPNFVVHYAEQIRDGLAQVDPAGDEVYAQNAENYINQLEELHAWILGQVGQLSPEERLLVTNHESFGYFADRYDFTIIGTILPSASTGSSPSAQQMVVLIEAIKAANAPAIFLESGTNPELAQQVASEAGVVVIENLLTHSVIYPGGYIEMMRHNTLTIVDSLK